MHLKYLHKKVCKLQNIFFEMFIQFLPKFPIGLDFFDRTFFQKLARKGSFQKFS